MAPPVSYGAMPVLCRGARRCHAVDDIQKLVRSFLIFVLPLSLCDQDLLDQFFTQWVPSVPRGMIGDFYFPGFHGHMSKAVSEAIHKCDGPVHRLNESDDDGGNRVTNLKMRMTLLSFKFDSRCSCVTAIGIQNRILFTSWKSWARAAW